MRAAGRRPRRHAGCLPRCELTLNERPDTTLRSSRLLYDATQALLGYFVGTTLRHFLEGSLKNLNRWSRVGLLGDDGRPNALFRRVPFDFEALNLENLAYACGVYFYVQASHKKANHHLLQHSTKRRVLYLRGYDYEVAVQAAPGLAMRLSTASTAAFNRRLGQALCPQYELYKVLSPTDVESETIGTDRFFYDRYGDIIFACSRPIRSFYLQAQHWQDDVEWLACRVDHFVVYVSSITDSALWELQLLRERGWASLTTVVFDRAAILNKALHSDIHATLPDGHLGAVLWLPPKRRSSEEQADELLAQLQQTFTVVAADAFEAAVPALCQRIAASSGPLPAGRREAWLDFRFHPAVDDAALQALRDLDAALWQDLGVDSDAAIDCLPYRLNQVQLHILTALLLGEHHAAGQALAVYAGVMQAALEAYTAAGKIDERVPAQEITAYLGLLQRHLDTAQHIAHTFLAAGRCNDFGDHTAAAAATYARLFGGSRARAAAVLR